MSNMRSITGLTWRDGLTSLLAVGIWIVTYLLLKGVMSVHSYRLGIVLLSSFGVGMCALGSNNIAPTTRIILKLETFLGVLALITSIYGLVVGTREAFILVSFLILTLWGIATFRHIIFR